MSVLTRRSDQPTARPTARHGLKAANTLPKSTLTGTNPSQNATYTNVGAMFCVASCVPKNPHRITSTSAATPIAPHTTSSARLVSTRESPSGSGRNRSCSSAGRPQEPSAANEITSTAAAAQMNNHIGIGRSALPTSPCALAVAGTVSSAISAAPSARFT